MTTRENKDLVQRLTDAWNERDRETFLELHADRVTAYRGSSDGQTRPAEELWESEESGIFEAFPDVIATTEFAVAEDDLVVVRWTVTGTHEGEYYGVEPTGEEVEYADWAAYRIENGEVTEAWWTGASVDLLEQIGAVDLAPA